MRCDFVKEFGGLSSLLRHSSAIIGAIAVLALILPSDSATARKRVLEGSRAIDVLLEREAAAERKKLLKAEKVRAQQQTRKIPVKATPASPASPVQAQTQMLIPVEQRIVKPVAPVAPVAQTAPVVAVTPVPAAAKPVADKATLSADLASSEPNSSSHRVIHIYNIHNKETIKILFKKNGRYIPAAMKKLNHFLRDWRTNQPIKMDRRLIDLVWSLQMELLPNRAIHLISGYRSPKTNRMLRKTRGGQARKSQHMVGRATDLHFPGVPVKKVRHAALKRQIGGVGYYPTSGLPFVHVDTGRVRHWPRIGRRELALLFPNGGSKHIPGGGRLRQKDLRIARATLRRRKAKPVMVAKTTPERKRQLLASLSQDVAALQAIKKYTQNLWVHRTRNESLLKKVALAPAPQDLNVQDPNVSVPQRRPVIARPRSGHWNSLWVNKNQANRPVLVPDNMTFVWDQTSSIRIDARDLPGMNPVPLAAPKLHQAIDLAPEWDEDHPDELAYRPMPLLPLMGETALSSDRFVSAMIEPDYARTALVFEDASQTSSLQMGGTLFVGDLIQHTAQLGSAAETLAR